MKLGISKTPPSWEAHASWRLAEVEGSLAQILVLWDHSQVKLPLLALVELTLLLVPSQPLEGEGQLLLVGFRCLRLLVENPASFISGRDSPWQA